MNRNIKSLVSALGSPGSLQAVFGASSLRDSINADGYVDEIVPEHIHCSISGSNSLPGRRSRLDESAGEGLRRNVLVRNAMLSSLEHRRHHLAEEASLCMPAVSTAIIQQSSSDTMDEEAQFFEDLLSELSGSDCSNSTSSILESSTHSRILPDSAEYVSDETNDDEDFVQLDSNLPTDPLPSHPILSACTNPGDQVAPAVFQSEQHKPEIRQVPALVDSCSSSFSAPPGCVDSGFAEETSRPSSAASCCTGYPNVCPYPATNSYVGGSNEELPALIDDDSDLDDDDDEVEDQVRAAQKPAHTLDPIPFGPDTSALRSPEGDVTLSRPLSPVTSPVHSMYVDHSSFRNPLSPEPSRPTSPISSASSKGDGDGPSPLILPSDLGALPSLAEVSLQLPAASGADLLTRPSRALAGAWLEPKLEVPSGPSASADRIRWTISPATYSREVPAAPSSSASNSQSHRCDIEHPRSSYSFVAANDPADNAIVVHWTR
uniref:Uncharacterized protein n=1 Tax=Ustilago esculenta TaxID=185366 RepID=A0A481SG04_9BASI|nr:hypothetical protein UEMT_1989 [Ustilago esculenta]